ncbi:2-amino-4-hydroxy-6-hydroxymethyldihydropteridine diphosphokinase [Nicoliella spurrieriana]|uniref:2-amino-4-hydroxy-6-hydroxymethyldihydropteridine diphosphokinase n=1 Tax=Nicoliella spurrieriana TaxID=2925830 RepID=A0A976RS17_9LACO|nr:2-amino-4-hydroxy-6-hydroxymethyldihydropteridine diphosphokinase [Nicoliella spurrieriana]UQS86739.1 2-amino-4-hydroxy-6-hydroxymethyldihydropteridine diphosphokinase [Nicoliella spurrieriana]
MTVAYLSLGSNLGDKLSELQQAVELLNADPQIEVTKVSDVYQTAPVGGVKQDDFYNLAAQIHTTLSAGLLLNVIHQIEQQLHRVRKIHWGPRTLDIDIITFGTEQIDTETLQIPHPEMNNRRFVLEPMMQIYDGDVSKLAAANAKIEGQEIEGIGSLIKL